MEKYVGVETVRAIAHDYLCVQNDEDAFMAEIDDAAVCVLSELEPQEDVAPVVHGRNMDNACSGLFECSVCGWSCGDTLHGDTETYNFCPNCGAKMDAD